MCRIKCSVELNPCRYTLTVVRRRGTTKKKSAITSINVNGSVCIAYKWKRKWGAAIRYDSRQNAFWSFAMRFMSELICVVALNCFFSHIGRQWEKREWSEWKTKTATIQIVCALLVSWLNYMALCVSSGICDGGILIKNNAWAEASFVQINQDIWCLRYRFGEK